MLRRNILKVSILFVGFILMGCTKQDIVPTPASHLSTLQPAPSTKEITTPMPPIPATTNLHNLITTSTDDLARRLSMPATDIILVKAEAVTWSDSSLGCPTKGTQYAQVLTPGYLIVLEHAGNQYEYHAGQGTDVIYCKHPIPPVPGVPGNT